MPRKDTLGLRQDGQGEAWMLLVGPQHCSCPEPGVLAMRIGARKGGRAGCPAVALTPLTVCYARAPQSLVLGMLPEQKGATVGVYAPHWLETAGWLTALLSDATAAAMGRLPSTKRPDTPRSMLGGVVSGNRGGLTPCTAQAACFRGARRTSDRLPL